MSVLGEIFFSFSFSYGLNNTGYFFGEEFSLLCGLLGAVIGWIPMFNNPRWIRILAWGGVFVGIL